MVLPFLLLFACIAYTLFHSLRSAARYWRIVEEVWGGLWPLLLL